MKRILPFVFSTALFAGAAAAETPMACGPHDVLLNNLAGKYQEQPVAMGLTTTGALVEVLSSTTGNSFSIIFTMPDGTACMVVAGRNWQSFMPRKPDEKT